MASGAERQRKYIETIRKDPARYEAYLAKERGRWSRRKVVKKIETIEDLPDRGKRAKRKYWREKKQQSRNLTREKEKMQQAAQQIISPPVSPEGPDRPNIQVREPSPGPSNVQACSLSRGRKHVRRDRSQAYREVFKLRVELAKKSREMEKCKKRCQRLKTQTKKTDSPNSKTLAMLDGCKVNRRVKCTLLFHNILIKTLREKYVSGKSRQKQCIYKAVNNSILTKYGLKTVCSKSLGIRRRKKLQMTGMLTFEVKISSFIEGMRTMVNTFLERDDNSRISTGKKDTITRQGNKRQRRVLLDSLKNLHVKMSGEVTPTISYSLFCQLRPFHIVPPNSRDRNTCLCMIHDNGQLMCDKLRQLAVITKELAQVKKCVDSICCMPTATMKCFYRTCEVCATKKVAFSESEEKIWWFEWLSIVETVADGESAKNVRKVVKKRRDGTVRELCAMFNEHLNNLAPHIYWIRHQFSAYCKTKELSVQSARAAAIVVDFSENYACKYASEIQSVHFLGGGSRNQASLHTGVAYINSQIISFCTISPSFRHDPAAIWAYLAPVIQTIKDEYPLVKELHFWSDGPTTQYRNKKNFYLFNRELRMNGFENCTWNMFEAGHGKGAADAVGGVVKRLADDQVCKGRDIPDAQSLYDIHTTATKSKVRFFFVDDNSIKAVEDAIPSNIAVVTGTMKLHQLLLSDSNEILVRNLSCFSCTFPKLCICYDTRSVSFPGMDIDTEAGQNNANDKGSNKMQNIVGTGCLVKYGKKLYPGIIVEADGESAFISTMHPIGENKFVEPNMPDELWFHYDDIVSYIDKPHKPTPRSRYYVVDPIAWSDAEKKNYLLKLC